MPEEHIFLDQGGVSISNSRMMVDGNTYAMSGVTAVERDQENPSRVGPIIVVVIGLITLFSGGGGIIVGGLIAAAGVAWWIKQKPTFLVMLTSSSGKVKAYHSKDGGFVNRVIQAINDAIVHRG